MPTEGPLSLWSFFVACW